MSLANTYLRQARSFARAGDAPRAVELLERARALAQSQQGEPEVMRGVLEELAAAYAAVGQPARSQRCREQLNAMFPPPPPAAPTPAADMSMPGQFAPAPYGYPGLPPARPGRWQSGWRAAVLVCVAAAFVAAAAIALVVAWPAIQPNPAEAGAGTTLPAAARTAATAEAPPLSVAASSADVPTTQVSLPASTLPTTLPALPVATTVAPATQPLAAVVMPQTAVVAAAAAAPDLADTVGLLVKMVHYEGVIGGRRIEVDIPVSNGTAFAVSDDGLMLTNRHVTEGPEKDELPATLEAFGMPTVTRRGTALRVCFGPDPADHYKASTVFLSDAFDLTLLRVDRRFDHPLRLTTTTPRQGDDVFVCGYPGEVIQLLNAAAAPADGQRRDELMEKARQSGSYDLLVASFSPDSFHSTLTRGIVSARERHIEGIGYLQTDAAVNPGNSGGPALNAKNEVVGIVTLKSAASQKYNFALLIDQLADELRPYLEVK